MLFTVTVTVPGTCEATEYNKQLLDESDYDINSSSPFPPLSLGLRQKTPSKI